MKILRIVCISMAFLLTFSCIYNNPYSDIDPYYTEVYWGKRRPRIPLLKPLIIYKGRATFKKWGVLYSGLVCKDCDNYHFDHTLGIDSIVNIGVDQSYVYGKIPEKKDHNERYNKGDFVFVTKYNTILRSPDYIEVEEGEIRIFPSDTVNKIFTLPERWFVINVADTTTEAFFSEENYNNYLKERGISGKMYNIDSLNTVYRETRILPWFPDSIKAKMRN